ncbi:MAG: hypothetical protein FJ091_18135 [Deltaproteobacteria bacterium]|nr:hypothetical protein [Deltaproteobacteria bacterium]
MSTARPALWQLAALACYGAALALLIPRHEPWFDEAQAWLLARDADLFELYAHWLRYEGNPGLWHALLVPLARGGAPFASMHVLAALFAFAGAVVFVLRAPFPAWVRALFPFTYFPLYQYAVVARPYALAPLVLFALAAIWPRRFERPFALAALLAALALASVHCWLIAAGLGALHVYELLSHRRELGAHALQQHALAMSALLAVGAFVALVLWPPNDHTMVVPGFALHPDRGFAVAWRFSSSSLTEIAPLSLAVIAASLPILAARRVLATFVLPAALLIAFAATKAYSEWHEGMLFLLWVFALWVAFARERDEHERAWTAGAALAALAAVLLVHASWALRSARYDWSESYSGAPAVARHLAETTTEPDTIFALGFGAFAVQPYFESNRFDNYRARTGGAFLDSSASAPWLNEYEAVLRARPDVVIVGVKGVDEQPLLVEPERLFPGYVPRVFRGALFWKNRVLEYDAYVVYRSTGRETR